MSKIILVLFYFEFHSFGWFRFAHHSTNWLVKKSTYVSLIVLVAVVNKILIKFPIKSNQIFSNILCKSSNYNILVYVTIEAGLILHHNSRVLVCREKNLGFFAKSNEEKIFSYCFSVGRGLHLMCCVLFSLCMNSCVCV